MHVSGDNFYPAGQKICPGGSIFARYFVNPTFTPTTTVDLGHIWLENTGQSALWLIPQLNPLGIKRQAGQNIEVGGSYPTYTLGDPLEIEYKCGQDGFEIFINGNFVATFSALHDRTTNKVPDITNVEIKNYRNAITESYISEFYFTYRK